MQDDIEMDCVRCGKRRHSFYDDAVGDLLSYLCEPRPWCNKVVAIAHNAKTFDSQFILKRPIFMKWNPQIILSGLKIISIKMQHIQFLDSISYLPMPLRKLPEAFGLSAKKSWLPHYWYTKAIWTMWAPYPTLGISALMRWVRERERFSCLGIMSKNTAEPALVETGDNLGQMTSDLKASEMFSEVVCAGPKNYEYRTIP